MTPSPTKKSKGEELYLVHLQRANAPDPHPEDTEDDHDYPHPRKIPGGKTVGEELYCVHLKRSQGLEPDYDVDVGVNPASAGGVAGVTDARGGGLGCEAGACGDNDVVKDGEEGQCQVQKAEEADAKDAGSQEHAQ